MKFSLLFLITVIFLLLLFSLIPFHCVYNKMHNFFSTSFCSVRLLVYSIFGFTWQNIQNWKMVLWEHKGRTQVSDQLADHSFPWFCKMFLKYQLTISVIRIDFIPRPNSYDCKILNPGHVVRIYNCCFVFRLLKCNYAEVVKKFLDYFTRHWRAECWRLVKMRNVAIGLYLAQNEGSSIVSLDSKKCRMF